MVIPLDRTAGRGVVPGGGVLVKVGDGVVDGTDVTVGEGVHVGVKVDVGMGVLNNGV